MKKDEIKRDPVVDKILGTVSYLRENIKFVIISLILLIAVILLVSRQSVINENKRINAIKSADSLIIDFINSGDKLADISDDFILDINRLLNDFPDSEEVSYLGILMLSSDSLMSRDRIKTIKNTISNDWFKTQIYIMSADLFSDEENYENSLKDYEYALSISTTNVQKAYINYKIGLVNSVLTNNEKSYSHHLQAKDLFEKSNELNALSSNLLFKDWMSRNEVALNKLKIILKK